MFQDPLDPLDVNDDHLIRNYRFGWAAILQMCNELCNDLERRTRDHALPVHT